MGAAVALGNIIGEALHAFLIAVVPLHRYFYAHALFFAKRVKHFFVQGVFFAVHVLHKAGHAAAEGEIFFAPVAFIDQFDADTVIQKRQFTDAFGQNIEVVFHQPECFFAGEKLHFGAFFVGVTHHFERRHGFAALEFDNMLFAVAVDGEPQPVGQGIHHRHAHAVQAAGDFVAVVVEFAARMQDGHNHFGCRAAFFGVDIGGNAAAVILNGDGIVGIDGH